MFEDKIDSFLRYVGMDARQYTRKLARQIAAAKYKARHPRCTPRQASAYARRSWRKYIGDALSMASILTLEYADSIIRN